MPSKAEQIISQELRTILNELPDGAEIVESEHFQRILSGLQFFVPEVLVEIYAEWRGWSLDGVYPVVARKMRRLQAEIFGLCVLISDQTLTPIHLRLQVAPSAEEISWLECRVGEREGQGMARSPFRLFRQTSKRLQRLGGRIGAIDWVYKVTFGEQSP